MSQKPITQKPITQKPIKNHQIFAIKKRAENQSSLLSGPQWTRTTDLTLIRDNRQFDRF